MTPIKISLKFQSLIPKTILFLLMYLLLSSQVFAQKRQRPDLAITNSTVFDSHTGKLRSNQTILLKEGIIVKVTGSKKKYPAIKNINAAGKLVTPGFVDTHIHPTDVFRSYGPLYEYLPKDSLEIYRKRLSDTYLPYGVTSAMIMGHSEKWLQPILDWQNNPQPNLLNLYTVGGAFISNEGRKPYINHAIMESPTAAKQKVIQYHNQGIRHIKLYWKLRRPEFEAALRTADSLDMEVYGHIDQNVMFIDSTLDIGLRNYEHVLTLANTVLRSKSDLKEFGQDMQTYYSFKNSNSALFRFVERLEMFRFIRDKKRAAIDSLINKLSKNNTTFSTGIHLMAEQFGLTYFSNTNTEGSLSADQLARSKENFRILMIYTKQLFDRGVKLRIGTDWPSGGKAFISEQLLLSENGFTIPSILQISTINGARALKLEDKYGSIEKGKNADLLIWHRSPFDDYKNFLSSKIIIKDGVVFDPK